MSFHGKCWQSHSTLPGYSSQDCIHRIWIPKEIISDAGINLTADIFRPFCREMKIEQAITLLCHHHSNSLVEVCVKFIKCLNTYYNVNLALLLIRSTPIDTGLPSSAILLFNRPIRGLLLQMNRKPINIYKDDAENGVFKSHQMRYSKDNDICTESLSFDIGSTVAMECKDDRPWMYGVIKEAINSHHNGRSCIVTVT